MTDRSQRLIRSRVAATPSRSAARRARPPTASAPGPPRAGLVDVGAIVSPLQVKVIEDLVDDAVAKGARVLVGGARALTGTGQYFAPTVLVDPSCNSWYNGGNVPGKKRMYMGYTGGIPEYRRRCDEIAASGYTGFKLA